jgi:hypothetical protein
MFAGFEWIDVAKLGALFAIGEFRAYFVRREKKKLSKVLGKEPQKIMLFESGKTRYLEYILYGLGGLLISASLIAGMKTGFQGEFVKGIAYGLGIIYLPTRFKNSQTIRIGDNGIVYNNFSILWEELDRVEWDRDIKQKSWGVKFYKKSQIVPLKMYVNRKYKSDFENKLKEYLDMYIKPH